MTTPTQRFYAQAMGGDFADALKTARKHTLTIDDVATGDFPESIRLDTASSFVPPNDGCCNVVRAATNSWRPHVSRWVFTEAFPNQIMSRVRSLTQGSVRKVVFEQERDICTL